MIRVKIRVDANSEIGMGHLVRCMALAYMLKEEYEISFYTFGAPKKIIDEILSNEWDFFKLLSEEDFISGCGENEIVVLDGYHFNSEYQKKIKSRKTYLVCITDIPDQHYYADLIINHAAGVSNTDYQCEPYTEFLLGPKYALLRPCFLEAAQGSVSIKPEIKQIFISFGGADPENFTSKVLNYITGNKYSITVLTGDAFRYQEELEKAVGAHEYNDVYLKSSLNAAEVCSEIQKCDLAIVPSSGMLLEVIACGKPLISGCTATNQLNIHNGFLQQGALCSAGSFDEIDFSKAWSSIQSFSYRIEMVKHQRELIDGNSSERIIKFIDSII